MRKVGSLLALVCVAACAKQPRQPSVSMNCDAQNATPMAVADTISKFRSAVSSDTTVGAGRASGTIVNAHTGEPLRYANVILRAPSGRYVYMSTADDGRFSLSLIPAGEKVLDVQLLGFERLKLRVDTRVGVRAAIALPIVRLLLMC